MIPYRVGRDNVALSTSNDYFTIIAGAVRSLLLTEVDAQGAGTASAHNAFGIYRVATAGTTGGGSVTPVPKLAPNMTGTTPALAFSGLVHTTWSVQPTLGALVQQCGLNANGQRHFWRANPNLNNAISVPGGNNAAASLSVRSISGTSNASIAVEFLEI
jgi:hypothetical protein